MEFLVPQGGSNIAHIDVYPVVPEKGIAQPWVMRDTCPEQPKEIDSLDVSFAAASSPQERQTERMIFVLSIAESVQTATHSWRFMPGGLMYCEGEADYLQNIDLNLSNDGKTLTATVKCLTDIKEAFNFTFLALQREQLSGECRIFASPDPGGTTGRY